jgi:hypothetical protein
MATAFVMATYAASIAYVLADSHDKYNRADKVCIRLHCHSAWIPNSVDQILGVIRLDQAFKGPENLRQKATTVEAADCIIWQGLVQLLSNSATSLLSTVFTVVRLQASVAIPGLVIHRVVHAAKSITCSKPPPLLPVSSDPYLWQP